MHFVESIKLTRAPTLVLMFMATGSVFAQPAADTNRCQESGVVLALPPGVVETPRTTTRMCSRSAPLLLGTYPSFDFWNLDTSGVRDTAGNLQFGMRLWEYSNPNVNFDRYVFNPAGQLIETALNWIGVGGQCVVTVEGHNDFLMPVATTQWFGMTDSQNNVHVVYTNVGTGGWNVVYKKLDPSGNTVIQPHFITTYADCWNWYLQPVTLHDDTLVITWTRGTEDICAVASYDHGESWTEVRTLLDRTNAPQMSCLKTVAGSDDTLHFVWRTLNWDTYEEELWYAKARLDGTILVGATRFFAGPCWYPFLSIDGYDNIHVTFGTTYDVCTNLYYTRLRGRLDLGGAPATDEQLTLIPERAFLVDAEDYVHYPLNLADENSAVHVVYERGGYGRNTDKDLYYVRICGVVGDLDCDEDVDLADLAALLGVYGVCEGGPGFEIGADFDGDGCVALPDLAALLSNYGVTP